eukprot:TRINITY_DN1188_c0_g1_i4.p1 TRINITY_DN1188_c0_g1~~TRINITY_DN1188_c0_g1_i4.p1  ORF type:complete len:291 (-),score=60.56 TRINITY_DN1188_c0_g1_i4:399-1271(-)
MGCGSSAVGPVLEIRPPSDPKTAEDCPSPVDLVSELSLVESAGQQVEVDLTWITGNVIGAGSYGTVCLGLVPTSGKLIAVKQLDYIEHSAADTERVSSIQMETAILSKLRHRNICGYIGSKSTPGADESSMILNILLEYVPGGSIASLIAQFGQLEEPTVKVYTEQILHGLNYLHTHRVTHRDIKGANILVTCDGVIKLTDFGHSKMDDQLNNSQTGSLNAATMKLESLKGSTFWMAPEVVKGQGYGRRADIWSLGCTIIEMAAGVLPACPAHCCKACLLGLMWHRISSQ